MKKAFALILLALSTLTSRQPVQAQILNRNAQVWEYRDGSIAVRDERGDRFYRPEYQCSSYNQNPRPQPYPNYPNPNPNPIPRPRPSPVPQCGGCNVYGCYVEGGGCNVYGCYAQSGGCNVYGCYTHGGGCNVYGCYYHGGSCNVHGCQKEAPKDAGKAPSKPVCQ